MQINSLLTKDKYVHQTHLYSTFNQKAIKKVQFQNICSHQVSRIHNKHIRSQCMTYTEALQNKRFLYFHELFYVLKIQKLFFNSMDSFRLWWIGFLQTNTKTLSTFSLFVSVKQLWNSILNAFLDSENQHKTI